MILNKYRPSAWYWVVAGSATQVWSSAACAYVGVANATYAAWLAAGHKPTAIDSEASLEAVLEGQYPAGWPGGAIRQQIAALEATQTPRRLREAVAGGIGAAWLAALDAQIATLRAQLAPAAAPTASASTPPAS